MWFALECKYDMHMATTETGGGKLIAMKMHTVNQKKYVHIEHCNEENEQQFILFKIQIFSVKYSY